jgi:EcsC protein family
MQPMNAVAWAAMDRIEDNPPDIEALERAFALLESPSVVAKLTHLVGRPLESALDRLPEGAARRVHTAVRSALSRSVRVALTSLRDRPKASASTRSHTLMSAASGAAGGFFGFAGLLVELPVTTTLMLRSIADIARSEGFSLQDPTVAQDCVAVFALGGPRRDDDAADTGYYATRAMLNEVLKHTAAALTRNAAMNAGQRGVSTVSAGKAGVWLAKLIETVASRFGVVITQKFAAQLVPVIGAASGAAVNALFIQHYQDMARGHFIIRRLEGTYGTEAVHAAYAGMARRLADDPRISLGRS